MRAELALAGALLAVGVAAAPSQGDYFARVDLDGDGRVSLPEFLDRMGYAFTQMDGDGNGVLEPQEQHLPDAKPLSRGEHEQRLTAQFHRQDGNDDGLLSPAELLGPPR